MPRLEPTIVKMTVSTTTSDNARAGRRKGRHRSSLPMPKDKRITAIGKPKNDMLPTMLWMVPNVVASPPTSIGKIPASRTDMPQRPMGNSPTYDQQVGSKLRGGH